MRTNHARERLRDGDATIGCFIGLGSPNVTELLAHAGFDWLVLETEHSAVDIAGVEHMLMACNGTNTIPLVRVPTTEGGWVQRALDIGALGVVVPFVETAEQATALVAATRYPPAGRRGFGPLRAGGYTFGNSEYLASIDENILTVAIIETRRAMDNIEDIAAVPGIDALYLGPADLCLSSGMSPLDPRAPELIDEALRELLRVGKNRGVAIGHGAGTPADVRRRHDEGVTMIGYGPDYGLLAAAARAGIAALPARKDTLKGHDGDQNR